MANNRPGDQPNYSNFNLICEFRSFQWRGRPYDQCVVLHFLDQTKWSDAVGAHFQLSGQLDVPLATVARTAVCFTLSEISARLFESRRPAYSYYVEEGKHRYRAFKFTIPGKRQRRQDSLSVTFSNRTESSRRAGRGNIGITFDLIRSSRS